MKIDLWSVAMGFVCFAALGCATTDIPSAHRGRLFDRTGPLAFFAGGHGLVGPVLNPGTHFVGTYDELRIVDCSTTTVRESLDTLTRDGVHFGFDISVRFAADCSDEGVKKLLSTMVPDKGEIITSNSLYATFIRPGIGEAVREVVSPVRANELNEKQHSIMDKIRQGVLDIMKSRGRRAVTLFEVNLSHLDFPDEMDSANVERAVQAVLRDKAIAERERITAEIETMKMRETLAGQAADIHAMEIDRIGAVLRKYPEYLQYDMQAKMPDIYKGAAAGGNLVIAAPSPSILVAPKSGSGPTTPAPGAPKDNRPPKPAPAEGDPNAATRPARQ